MSVSVSSSSKTKKNRARRSSGTVRKFRVQKLVDQKREDDIFQQGLNEGLKLYAESREQKIWRAKYQSSTEMCNFVNENTLKECTRKL